MALPKTIPFDAPKTIPFASTTIKPTTLLDPSTYATRTTFPASGKEGLLGTSANLIGNIPRSSVEFVKTTFDFLNPLNTIKSAQNLGTALGTPGQPDVSFMDVAKEFPNELYKAVVPQFIQHTISGNFDKASATLQNDPIGQILPLLFIARSVANKAGVGTQFDNAISQVASPVTKTTSAVGKGIKSVTTGATKFTSSQLTGLSPHTLEQVVRNPQEFTKQAQSLVTRPALAENIKTAIEGRQTALSDTGVGYEAVRTQSQPIQVNPSYLSDLIKKTTGLQVAGGKLRTSGSASIRLPNDVAALQSKLYDIWQPEFQKGFLTPDQFMNLRSDISKMVYNENGIKSGELATLSSKIREALNTDLRPQVQGLESIDKAYAPQIKQLTDLAKGLVDKQGNLSDAAINRIANATGKGKDPLLARLEQLSPGITDRIKILKAVEDIQNSRENKPGTYLRAGALGAGIVTLNPYLIVSAIMSLPEVAVPLLRGLGISGDVASGILNNLGIKQALGELNSLKVPTVAKEYAKNPKMGASISDVTKNVDSRSGLPMNSDGKIINDINRPLKPTPYFEKLRQLTVDRTGNSLARNFPEIWRQRAMEEYIQQTNTRRFNRPEGQELRPGASASYIETNAKYSPHTKTQPIENYIKNSDFIQYSPELIKKIDKQLLGDKTKAVVIDADVIKKMHPEYDPKNPATLHEESSSLTKALVEKAIDEDTSGRFVATGGGSGSGKSEVVLPRLIDKPGVIFDGTLAGENSIKKKIDYALSKGKKVEIRPVYSPIPMSTYFNAKRTRSVPLPTLIDSHAGFRNTIPNLLAEYGDRIKIIPYENKYLGIKGGNAVETSNLAEYLNSQKMTREQVKILAEDTATIIEEIGLKATEERIMSLQYK